MSSKSNTSIYDQRIALEGQGNLGVGSHGKGTIEGDILDFSGINLGYDAGQRNRNTSIAFPGQENGPRPASVGGAGPAGSLSGSTFNAGDFTANVTTNDPRAALLAIDKTYDFAGKSVEAISASEKKTQEILEKNLADTVDTVKSLALPADQRQFSTSSYIAGAVVVAAIIAYAYINRK